MAEKRKPIRVLSLFDGIATGQMRNADQIIQTFFLLSFSFLFLQLQLLIVVVINDSVSYFFNFSQQLFEQ